MLITHGLEGGTPIHPARAALQAADPALADVEGPGLDLALLPRGADRAPRKAHAGAWYDLIWVRTTDRILTDFRTYSHSTEEERRHLARLLIHSGIMPKPLDDSPESEELDRWMTAGTIGQRTELLFARAVAQAGQLPMPKLRPVQERLAEAAPVTLEGWSEEHVRLYGGREKLLEYLQQRQYRAVKNDRTMSAYDWNTWGREAADVIRALPVPEAVL